MADTITRYYRRPPFDGSAREYEVMLQSEADARGIEYTPDWRTADPGDWVLTGDGWVGELVMVNVMPTVAPVRGILFELSFSFATDKFIVARATSEKEARKYIQDHGPFSKRILAGARKSLEDLRYGPYRSIGQGYSEVVPRTWIDRLLRTKRGKIAVEMFAQRLVQNDFRFKEQDFYDIGMVLRPDDDIPQAKAKIVYRQQPTQKKVVARVAEILTGKGITMEWIIDKTIDAIDLAASTGNAKVMLEGIDRMQEHIEKNDTNDGTEAKWTLLESGAPERPKAKRLPSPDELSSTDVTEENEADPAHRPEEPGETD